MEEDLTLGDGNTMQYTDDISWNCTLEIYMVVSTTVTPVNLIIK